MQLEPGREPNEMGAEANCAVEMQSLSTKFGPKNALMSIL